MRNTLAVINLCLAFYNVGTIWANEVDIFRSWKLLDNATFHKVHAVHWHKIPFWIFIPYALFFAVSILLVWYPAPGSPAWAVWGNLACFVLAIALTGAFWAPWQAKLESDNTTGGRSPWLKKILDTHWIRVVLVNASAGFALALVLAPSTKV
jgi:hypothetical protein